MAGLAPDLNPTRECPSCALETPAMAEVCPYCGYEFPIAKPGVRPMAWVMIVLMLLLVIPLLAWLFG